MYVQGDAVRDFVFPLAVVSPSHEGLSLTKPLGSAFLIGNRGFALTAKHVISGCSGDEIAGLFVLPDGGWVGFRVEAREMHPTEDVALVRISGGPWASPFRLSGTSEHASCRYRLFGYPDDTTYEIVRGHKAVIRPDLVYNEGYIRRRVTGSVPAVAGSSFFELSEIAGGGSSGAPVFKFSKPTWDVIGIYVGEKTNDRSTSVSFAVREESFRDWSPSILRCSVYEESQAALGTR